MPKSPSWLTNLKHILRQKSRCRPFPIACRMALLSAEKELILTFCSDGIVGPNEVVHPHQSSTSGLAHWVGRCLASGRNASGNSVCWRLISGSCRRRSNIRCSGFWISRRCRFVAVF